jgi:hypothetical protein
MDYPKYRHHGIEQSVIVADPNEELELTPSSEGWNDLKRDALEDVAKKKKSPKPLLRESVFTKAEVVLNSD